MIFAASSANVICCHKDSLLAFPICCRSLRLTAAIVSIQMSGTELLSEDGQPIQKTGKCSYAALLCTSAVDKPETVKCAKKAPRYAFMQLNMQ